MMSSSPMWRSVQRVRRMGVAETSRRLARRLYYRLDAGSLDFPLLEDDIADSRRLDLGTPPVLSGEGANTIGWVCTPPSPGSGGHTTLFRMITGLEQRGYRCVLFLYDRHRGDHDRHVRVVRENWPDVMADVRDAFDGFAAVDACVATSWETAHVLARRLAGVVPLLYFIQDFEPYFYPRGAMYALAEDTYRFGFRNIALGDMVAGHLAAVGAPSVVAPFGCDTETYFHTNRGPRSGVVFYARQGTDRRGYILGKRALEEFHVRHPEQEIHLYGGGTGGWRIPVVQHGRLTPRALNELYNRSLGGLALSFTNISLVAEEMLAAGAIPVINDSADARDDLPSTSAEWAAPTPVAIADALCRVVEEPDPVSRSIRAANSVRRGWSPAQAVVVNVVAETLAIARRP